MKLARQALLLGALVLSLLPVQTAGEDKNPRSQSLMIVRGDGHWPPYEYIEDGQLKGIHIELIQLTARTLQLPPPEFVSVPWPRALHMVGNGEANAITYIPRGTARERLVFYHEGNVLSEGSMALFTDPVTAESLSGSWNLEIIKPFIIGVVRGYHYSDAFDNASQIRRLNSATDEERLIKQFKAGRFTIGAGDMTSLRYWANRHQLAQPLVFLTPYLAKSRKHYLGFSRKSSSREFTRRFGLAMQSFKASSNYQRLLCKYNNCPDGATPN